MTTQPITHGKILAALVMACALASFFAQPAVAQTAKKLKCNGCLTSKQLKNGKVKGKDLKDSAVTGSKIAPNAVDSAKVANGSLTAVDLGDEAGLEFVGGNDFDLLTATPAVIRTVTLSAPSSGFVIVHASGGFEFASASFDSAECSITLFSIALDGANNIRAADGNAVALFQVPFGSTRVFLAPAGGGSATYNLVCQLIDGSASVSDTHLTALFVPTRY